MYRQDAGAGLKGNVSVPWTCFCLYARGHIGEQECEWGKYGHSNPRKWQMGEVSIVVGPGNMSAFFFHRWPISTVGREELVGAKESQVLEITLWHGSTGKEFLEYINFLF